MFSATLSPGAKNPQFSEILSLANCPQVAEYRDASRQYRIPTGIAEPSSGLIPAPYQVLNGSGIREQSCQVSPGQIPQCTSAPAASPPWELNNICHYTKACKILSGFLYAFKDFYVSSREYLKELHSLR